MTQIIQPSLEEILEAINGGDTQLQLLATQATRYMPGCWSCAGACKLLFEELSGEMEPGNPNCPWESQLVPVLWPLCCAWLIVLHEPSQEVGCAARSCACTVPGIILDPTRNRVPDAWAEQGLESLAL